MSIGQLMQMNEAAALAKYPYYANNENGPVGDTRVLLQQCKCLFANQQCVPNDCRIMALSAPITVYRMVSEDFSGTGIVEDNNYTNTVGTVDGT
jgi:hypothetical protein